MQDLRPHPGPTESEASVQQNAWVICVQTKVLEAHYVAIVIFKAKYKY